MRLPQIIAIACVLIMPLVIGCGGSNEPATVADENDIEQFLKDNPDMAVDVEQEAQMMADDEAVEGE